MTVPQAVWYIVRQESGHCTIVPSSEFEPNPDPQDPGPKHWGPFDAKPTAIAHRVGLIRAGKCQPV